MPEIRIPLQRTEKDDYEKVEEKIRSFFKENIYQPLMQSVRHQDKSVQNTKKTALQTALEKGRVTFYRGEFKGLMSAEIGKELKEMGATYSRASKAYKLPLNKAPQEVQGWINSSTAYYSKRLTLIDKKIAGLRPDLVLSKINFGSLFEKMLAEADDDLDKKMEALSIKPQLTKKSKERLKKEYTEGLERYIKDFTNKEIRTLRSHVKKMKMKGVRFSELEPYIVRRFGVSKSKAKFLARQETSLVMAKFREQKIKEAGSDEYRWKTVVGSPNHPVRPAHKVLNNTIQKWSKPPITSKDGRRNHPGEDFNCRCYAEAIIKF